MKKVFLASAVLSFVFSSNLFAADWYGPQGKKCEKAASPAELVASARISPGVPEPQFEDVFEDGEIVAVKVIMDAQTPGTRKWYKHTYMIFRGLDRCQNFLDASLQNKQQELDSLKSKYE